jgi:endonuclease/exonuclease/phosphatase family metal-dependent hydrolase
MNSFKLLSYNIMSGCFENYESTSKLTARFDLLKDVLKLINADFVGLCDTFKWKDTFTSKELKQKFGYKHVMLVDMEDTRVEKEIGVAVMTNLDVKEFNIIRAFNRNYIEAVLEDLNIYTCYFDDLSEDTRIKEAKSLLEQIKKPAIIHGDLNTFAKADLGIENKAKTLFEQDNEQLSAQLKPIIDGMQRGEVIEILNNNGFIDAEITFNPTMPSKLFPAKVTEPFVRVDYILHTSDIQAKDVTVHKDTIFHKTSDHFPLSATINY